jgi:hypothetical protein
MSIRFSCSCGRKLKVSDEKIGMKVLCSSCGATLKVPKKSQDEYWQDVPAKSDEPKVDYVGALKDFLVQFVPGATVLVLLAWGAYYLSSQIIVGRGNLPALAGVSGKVTLDGQPLPYATVRFIPLEEGKQTERKGASVALGITDENGQYRLFYIKDTAGAAIGPSRVEIEAKDKTGRERVRPEFNVQSTLQREVKSGSQQLDFDVHGRESPTPSTDAATPTPPP